MSLPSQTEAPRDSETPKCLARSVADALATEPTLEAVTINRARQTISVATLGRADVPRLTERITTTIRKGQEADVSHHCHLLAGEGDCQTCDTPLSPQEREKIAIRHDGDTTTIARVTCPTAPTFWRWRDIPWPKMVQRDVEFLEHAEHIDEWKPQLAAAILCGVFGLGAYFAGAGWITRILYAFAYVAGAWFTVEEVWARLKKSTIDVHFLMLAVAVGSASIGAWGEGAMLLFLFSLSGALEHFALGRTQREIRSLFKAAPKVAIVVDERGREREVPVEQLRPGMRLLLKPGAQFPVDAELVKGQTAADESNLTGEATPVEKGVGDSVLAGTLNLWGAVEASVLRPAAESSLQKIIRLIQEAQHQKAPAQRFTDKFGTVYTYLVLALSLVMFFIWWLGLGLSPFTATASRQSAFYHTMTLLVVASPCALVLSIPSAVLAAIAWGARRGILFRGGAAVEKLAEVNVVALDKTGTLTTGELKVERVESFPPGQEQEIAQLAYSLERLSAHPLARAITRHGKHQQLAAVELTRFESVTGLGVKALHGEQRVLLGRREWLAQGPQAAIIRHVPPTEPGFSEVWLARDGLVGRVLLRDDIRPQARAVVEQLRQLGLRSVVLTGDRQATGDHLKRQLGLDDVRAELKPEQKVEVIGAFTQAGDKVAMVGDGVNDAPSLAAAHVGVAMGARGSDAALEQSEVVLMHDRLENFLAAFRLSQRARAIIRQNLVVSLGTVAVLVSFAMFGAIPLTVGVVGHEGSTVIVVMNSLRLLFGRFERRAVDPVRVANAF
ncbi:MAG: cadmium-translocating P-type ATPase [Verrucomicrobia bacterium]|nr:cadmium-translocating P-type ATPase [Verrucomicrobiota bacterium]